MPIIEVNAGAGYFGAGYRRARADYSFAVQGGAISTIGLTGSTFIPSGALIMGGFIEVTTALTSGGSATIAVQVEGAGDIVPATAVASWTTGRKNITPTLATGSLTAASIVKTTAPRDISVVIATAALTAGVFKVILEFIEPMTP